MVQQYFRLYLFKDVRNTMSILAFSLIKTRLNLIFILHERINAWCTLNISSKNEGFAMKTLQMNFRKGILLTFITQAEELSCLPERKKKIITTRNEMR